MPRFALLADIHGNLEALEAVLDDLADVDVDQVLCLGDVVGYGADPGACIELVYDVCDAIVLGNHDEAAVRDEPLARFNPAARASALWTRERLGRLHRAAINTWPLSRQVDGVTIAHASLGPDPWEYLYTTAAALRTFDGFSSDFAAVGHTHLPSAFFLQQSHALVGVEDAEVMEGGQDGRPRVGGKQLVTGPRINLPAGGRFIVNPGSVGQPRDRNPDAAWAVLDTEARSVQIRRVAYDIEAASHKIRLAGLPDTLGQRLRLGA